MTIRPPWLDELLINDIDVRINRDPRTTPGTFLGWPRDQIFWDILGGGQADFDAPAGSLSGDDRALLYAKYNQPRHLDELAHAFKQLFAGSTPVGLLPTIIDLGCGPFTAGLALASTLGQGQAFRYYGVDRAVSMRRLGEILATSARDRGAFHAMTTWHFGDTLAELDFGAFRGEITLMVASYLLASPTLDVEQLVAAIQQTLPRIGLGPAALFFTNSGAPRANEKTPRFFAALRRAGFTCLVDDTELFSETSKASKPMKYALFFRQASTLISLGED